MEISFGDPDHCRSRRRRWSCNNRSIVNMDASCRTPCTTLTSTGPRARVTGWRNTPNGLSVIVPRSRTLQETPVWLAQALPKMRTKRCECDSLKILNLGQVKLAPVHHDTLFSFLHVSDASRTATSLTTLTKSLADTATNMHAIAESVEARHSELVVENKQLADENKLLTARLAEALERIRELEVRDASSNRLRYSTTPTESTQLYNQKALSYGIRRARGQVSN